MYLIIPAAGQGTRLGLGHNKIFAELKGKTILEHTLDRVMDENLDIILVHHPLEEEVIKEFLQKKGYEDIHLVPGGDSRQDSVRNGLTKVLELEGGKLTDVLVGVHDAARFLVSSDLLHAVFAKAKLTGAAIPVIPVTDTIKALGPHGISTPNRAFLRAAQTPQVARFKDLYKAHEAAYEKNLHCSDDAQVLELYGVDVALVEGERQNIKVTHPEDFILGAYYLDQDHDVRVHES